MESTGEGKYLLTVLLFCPYCAVVLVSIWNLLFLICSELRAITLCAVYPYLLTFCPCVRNSKITRSGCNANLNIMKMSKKKMDMIMILIMSKMGKYLFTIAETQPRPRLQLILLLIFILICLWKPQKVILYSKFA